MNLKEILDQMDNRTLLINLAVTQAILFVIGLLLYVFFLLPETALSDLLHTHHLSFSLICGIAFAALVVSLDLVLMRLVPQKYWDDGGVNERLFRDVNVFQIVLIALCVSFVEEWLFRGVLQNIVGWVWASLLFALIHFRYLHNLVYGSLIVIISFGFGLLYELTGSFWSVLVAHFAIDFSLGLFIRYRWLSFFSE